MTRLTRHTTRLIMLQAFAVLGIVAVLGALPVCDAAAYAPFANASDFRTVTERRDVTIHESQPGTRYLHGPATNVSDCASCQAADDRGSDPTATHDTLAERAAAIDRADTIIEPAKAAVIDPPADLAVSRAIAPDRLPPRVATI